MLRIFSALFWLLVVALGILFAAANPHTVQLHYYVGSMEIQLAAVALLGIWIGALLGIAFTLFWVARLRYENRRLRKTIEQAARELAARAPAATRE
jgi:uncharacterized integral membrane protein